MKKAYLVAFLVIGIALGFTMWAFSSGMSPYVTLKEARHSATPVQVRGIILHATAHYDTRENALRFVMEDQNKERIDVVYHGAKPDSFDTASGTAAHGLLRKDRSGKEVFMSDSLVLQCSSKYSEKNGPYRRAEAGGGSSI